jgi:hypothetical protein
MVSLVFRSQIVLVARSLKRESRVVEEGKPQEEVL